MVFFVGVGWGMEGGGWVRRGGLSARPKIKRRIARPIMDKPPRSS